MKNEFFVAGILAGAAVLSGCTDAGRSKFGNWVTDTPARITCYSGGKVTVDTFSTGKVNSESNSDGYNFRDKYSDRLREVSGDCDIDYDAGAPQGFKPTDARPKF